MICGSNCLSFFRLGATGQRGERQWPFPVLGMNEKGFSKRHRTPFSLHFFRGNEGVFT